MIVSTEIAEELSAIQTYREVLMPDYALISIVSEQAMPNVMAVLQDDRHFGYLDFIVSADARNEQAYDRTFDRIYKRLEAFLVSQDRMVTRRPPVHPYDLAAVLKTCQDAIDIQREAGREVIFNITGGTKVMATAAYLCAQRNGIEVIYVESRDRYLITFPPPDDFGQALATGALASSRRHFIEDRFHAIDVPAYVALYGRQVASSIAVDNLTRAQIEQARSVVRHYSTVRPQLARLQQEITRAHSDHSIAWPFRLVLHRLSRQQRAALGEMASHDLVTWDDTSGTLSCDKEQASFLKGGWLEVFTLYSLATSGWCHDVRGNVKLEGMDGEWDIMLTANAKLAIIECKSDATLSEQFGKIRAVQRDLGGPYAYSFFVRSGAANKGLTNLAGLYGISKVIDCENLPRVADIVAETMGIERRTAR